MRRLLLLAALSVVFTLAFSSVGMALSCVEGSVATGSGPDDTCVPEQQSNTTQQPDALELEEALNSGGISVDTPQKPNGFADSVYNQALTFGFTGGVPLPESSLESLPDNTQQFVEGYIDCGDEAVKTARDTGDVAAPNPLTAVFGGLLSPVIDTVSTVLGLNNSSQEFNETRNKCDENLSP